MGDVIKASILPAADGPNAPEPATPAAGDRPAWLPEQFESPEDLAKSYAELRAKMDGKAGEPEPASEGEPAGDETADGEGADDVVQTALSKAGINADDIAQRFSQDGKISDEDYSALAKAGFSKSVVDSYLRGVAAGSSAAAQAGEQLVAEVVGSVGGEAQFEALLEWAATQPPDVSDAYNKAVERGDGPSIKAAVLALNTARVAAEGIDPSRNPSDGGARPQAGSVFRSVAELKAAQRDPRYASDPAYRADVEAKAIRSSVW